MQKYLIFSKIKNIFFRLVGLASEVVPLFSLFHIWDSENKLIRKKKFFKALEKKDSETLSKHIADSNDFNRKKTINVDDIKHCHEREIERKKTIEEKAKACLLAITLSITLILGMVTLIFKNPIEIDKSNILRNSGFILIFSCGVLYFLYAGYAASRSIRIDEFSDISLEDEIKIKEEKASRQEELIQCIELNRLVTRKRSNYLDSSYIGIRNGIICLSLCFVILILNAQGINVDAVKSAFRKKILKNRESIVKIQEIKNVDKASNNNLKSK